MAFAYLSVYCVWRGILPNRITYPLAAATLIARPDGIGLIPIDHVVAGVVVLGLGYVGYSRGVTTAGIAKVAGVVGLSAGASIGLPVLVVTAALLVVLGLVLVTAGIVKSTQTIRYGALVPLAGIHSILVLYLPVTTTSLLVGIASAAILVVIVSKARSENAPPLTSTVATIKEPATRSSVAAASVERRIGQLVPIPAGSTLRAGPSNDSPLISTAATTSSGVLLGGRGDWVQVRDAEGSIGWLTLGTSGGDVPARQIPHRIRVVVVDDIDEMRSNISKLIGFESDMEVIGTASDGEAGVRLVQTKRPDIVLMDVNMPIMDGITATEIIANTVPGTSVIIMSAQSSSDYARRAMLAGATEYLVEPFTADALVRTIRRIGSDANARR